MPAGSASLQRTWIWIVLPTTGRPRSVVAWRGRPSRFLPVEVLPELEIDPVDDPGQLFGAATPVGVQHVRERLELGQVRAAVLGRFRHRHLPCAEAAIRLAGMDPEPFGRLLGEEFRRLSVGDDAQEEPGAETN